MEEYKEIRKRHAEGESQRKIASELGLSRNTVKRYCEGAETPWTRKERNREATVLTEEITDFIKECLEEDEREGLKKQKHTAKRIYDRLVTERGFTGGESTVRRKVRELKGTLQKAFIPLSFEAGEAMQVDWGEGSIYLAEEKIKVNIFCARLCYSCRPVVLAYSHQNEECFLDAFSRVFEELGGVPSRVIFDNARVAVKEGFGVHAKKQKGYTALSAHYAFTAEFCNPASGHEKGLVEGLVGWARRNIFVPVPHVESLSDLNEILAKRCQEYERHQIAGRPATVGEMFSIEQKELRALPLCRFETAKSQNGRVSAYSTVRFQTNDYSVPTKYVGQQVGVKAYPEEVKIYSSGELVAEHKRLYGKNEKSCRLIDYLPLLEERGRALMDAIPIKQNVSEEAFKELMANINDKEQVKRILRREAGLPEESEEKQCTAGKMEIKESPTMECVDLHDYDELLAGQEK